MTDSIDQLPLPPEFFPSPLKALIIPALQALADYGHIEVDIGEGPADAHQYVLAKTYSSVCSILFPKITLVADDDYRYCDEQLSIQDALQQRALDLIDDGCNRFSDFPDIVRALTVLRPAIEHVDFLHLEFHFDVFPNNVAAYRKSLIDLGEKINARERELVTKRPTAPPRHENASTVDDAWEENLLICSTGNFPDAAILIADGLEPALSVPFRNILPRSGTSIRNDS